MSWQPRDADDELDTLAVGGGTGNDGTVVHIAVGKFSDVLRSLRVVARDGRRVGEDSRSEKGDKADDKGREMHCADDERLQMLVCSVRVLIPTLSAASRVILEGNRNGDDVRGQQQHGERMLSSLSCS